MVNKNYGYHICSNRGLVSNRSLSRLKAGVDRLIKIIEAGLKYTPGQARYTLLSDLPSPNLNRPRAERQGGEHCWTQQLGLSGAWKTIKAGLD